MTWYIVEEDKTIEPKQNSILLWVMYRIKERKRIYQALLKISMERLKQ